MAVHYTSVIRNDYFNWFVVFREEIILVQTVLTTPASIKPFFRCFSEKLSIFNFLQE